MHPLYAILPLTRASEHKHCRMHPHLPNMTQEALRGLRHSRTTLIVAHRLSTIADADVIVVMKLGCVRDYGT